MMPEIRKRFHVTGGGCYPDWDEIEEFLDLSFPSGVKDRLWMPIVRDWLGVMAKGYNLNVFETDHLVMMGPFEGGAQARAGAHFESALLEMLAYLGKAVERERVGKLAVLVFPDSLSYSNYVCEFSQEGSITPMSGGMCITETGYVHLALYWEEGGDLVSIFVHEAAHAYLCDRELPIWMNEALAMRMEELVAGRLPMDIDRMLFRQHQSYWTAETLTQFVSGESWQIPGESFQLSYQLAEIIWRKIETTMEASPEEIQELIQTASYDDGGEKALQALFGVGLNDFFRSFLG